MLPEISESGAHPIVSWIPFEKAEVEKSKACSQTVRPEAGGGTVAWKLALPFASAWTVASLLMGGLKRASPKGVFVGPPPARE